MTSVNQEPPKQEPPALITSPDASADLLARELAQHPKVVRAADLEEAVELAAGLARPGGVVLLSPAYKSFDMFNDYEDRGRQFKALVRKRFERWA